jgi:triosephosphate isomerase (TIM)
VSSHKTERRVIIAGNWKMHKTRPEAHALAQQIKEGTAKMQNLPEIILVPPFTALQTVAEVIKGTSIALGAQNMDHHDSGAYTGEISPSMLKDLGVTYVLVGHSERRQFFGETNQSTNLRVKAALAHGIHPILCVGETLDERESELTDSVVSRQVAAGLAELTGDQLQTVIIAYEPVWAIGTGKNCDAAEADRVGKLIRNTISSLFAKSEKPVNADTVPVLYGGSVKPSNITDHLHEHLGIDGGLVGGASLKAEDFIPLIEAGAKRLKAIQQPVGA